MFRGLLSGATLTGLEPATSAVTGRRSDQLSYKTRFRLLTHSDVGAGDQPYWLPF